MFYWLAGCSRGMPFNDLERTPDALTGQSRIGRKVFENRTNTSSPDYERQSMINTFLKG